MNETDAPPVLMGEPEATHITCPIHIEATDHPIRVTLGQKQVLVYPAIVAIPLSDEELRTQLSLTGYSCDSEESLRIIADARPDLVTTNELYALGNPKLMGDRTCFPFVQRDEQGYVRFGFGSPTDRQTGEVLKGTRILAISSHTKPPVVPQAQ